MQLNYNVENMYLHWFQDGESNDKASFLILKKLIRA